MSSVFPQPAESIADMSIMQALCGSRLYVGKQWNSQGPATSPLKAALCSDLSQTPCDLTSPICLGIRYVILGQRHYMWSHGEKEAGLPPLQSDSQDGFAKFKALTHFIHLTVCLFNQLLNLLSVNFVSIDGLFLVLCVLSSAKSTTSSSLYHDILPPLALCAQ